MDEQHYNECVLHEFVAQGACYPLAMMVWQQLLPRGPARLAGNGLSDKEPSSYAMTVSEHENSMMQTGYTKA